MTVPDEIIKSTQKAAEQGRKALAKAMWKLTNAQDDNIVEASNMLAYIDGLMSGLLRRDDEI